MQTPSELPRGITLTRHESHRVRATRGGRRVLDRSGLTETEARELLATVPPPGPEGPDAEAQLAAMPDADLKGIRRRHAGFVVELTRDRAVRYGGYFAGPDALLRAIVCRNGLHRKYPPLRMRETRPGG